MKRYIKPQIEILSASFSTAMLAGSDHLEGSQLSNGMAKNNPFSFADEQSEQEAPLQSDITIDSVWE